MPGASHCAAADLPPPALAFLAFVVIASYRVLKRLLLLTLDNAPENADDRKWLPLSVIRGRCRSLPRLHKSARSIAPCQGCDHSPSLARGTTWFWCCRRTRGLPRGRPLASSLVRLLQIVFRWYSCSRL